MDPADAHPQPATAAAPGQEPVDPAATAAHPHNFEIQKEEHRRIRNDPDYDDWEYGTEPLPHEAWVPGRGKPPAEAADASGS